MEREVPKVSVLMIAYNKEQYIGEAIAGVVHQRCDFPIELIVMDDCSTDRTADIVKGWQARYPEIVNYHRNERNLGLQGNYLAGFKHCQGEYLAICDADDYWFYKKKLAKMVGYMDEHPECAISFHRVVNFYEATGEKSFSNGGMKTLSGIEELSRSNYITNLSVLYRRNLVDIMNLPDWIKDDRSPDYALHMLYAAKGNIRFFARPMGVYRKAAGSAWSTNERYGQLKMSLSVRLRLLEEFMGNGTVETGLRDSIKRILEAMLQCGINEDRRLEIEKAAKLASIRREELRATSQAVKGRGLVSKVRGVVSKLVTLPKP